MPRERGCVFDRPRPPHRGGQPFRSSLARRHHAAVPNISRSMLGSHRAGARRGHANKGRPRGQAWFIDMQTEIAQTCQDTMHDPCSPANAFSGRHWGTAKLDVKWSVGATFKVGFQKKGSGPAFDPIAKMFGKKLSDALSDGIKDEFDPVGWDKSTLPGF